MIKCTNCGYYNLDSSKLCVKCKTALNQHSDDSSIPKIICPFCNAAIPQSASVCPNCKKILSKFKQQESLPEEKNICAECGHHNSAECKYCEHCGKYLGDKNFCHYCGNRLEPDDLFCQACGKKISENILVSTETETVKDSEHTSNFISRSGTGNFNEHPKDDTTPVKNISEVNYYEVFGLLGPPKSKTDKSKKVNVDQNYVGDWSLNLIFESSESFFIKLSLLGNGEIIDVDSNLVGRWIFTESKLLAIILFISEDIFIYLIGKAEEKDKVSGYIFDSEKKQIGNWSGSREFSSDQYLKFNDLRTGLFSSSRLSNLQNHFSQYDSRSANKLRSYLLVDEKEVHRWYRFIKDSKGIVTNPVYNKIIQKTNIYFAKNDFTVNAFATEHEINSFPVQPPFIAIYEGICVTFKIAALAFSLAESRDDRNQYFTSIKNAMQKIGGQILDKQGEFDYDSLVEVLNDLTIGYDKLDEILSKSASLFAGCLIAVISHEMGHICLAHTSNETVNPDEISREQERQADSFAKIIIQNLEYTDYNSYGGLISRIIFVWFNESTDLTTHPNSRERVYNFINDNKSLENLGINRNSIDEFLPLK